jgi:hypothetical protein
MIYSYEYITVMGMKRVLLSFLMLTILTPTLVCGSIMADLKEAQASSEMTSSNTMKCHENDKSPSSDGIMFMTDCMKVDLFGTDNGYLIGKNDQSSELFAYDFDYIAFSHQLLDNTDRARAPPEYEIQALSSNTPIILVTQRFLI